MVLLLSIPIIIGKYAHFRRRFRHVTHPVRDRFGRAIAGLSTLSAETNSGVSIGLRSVGFQSFHCGFCWVVVVVLPSVNVATASGALPRKWVEAQLR